MKAGWYILNYHDVSWEQSPFIRAVGDSFSPDIFHEHVAALAKKFELVSVQEGWARLQNGDIDQPILSFWFDDGYAGVRKYAFPILEDAGVKAGMAVNSSFMLRKDFYWRLKLGFLAHVDGLRFLRQRLRTMGYKGGDSVRSFTLQNCSAEIIAVIDELFVRFTSEEMREDVFRHFDDVEGIRFLLDHGWEISNHTAAHYPVSDANEFQRFERQFAECESELEKSLGVPTRFWVLPFGMPFTDPSGTQVRFEEAEGKERALVYVGSKINQHSALHKHRLSRILVPIASANELLVSLSRLAVYKAG